MKALQITAPGRFEIRDVPTPQPGPGEVVMKVLAVTTCPHWDMHILGGEPMREGFALDYPYTIGQPGHEACGEVATVGAEVKSVRVGQRVCAWRDPGHHRPGCYAQYVLMDAENVIPVPDELPPEACAPLELAMCVSAHLLLAMRLEVIAGQKVGVFGLGPAGLCAVQLLRAAGATEIIGFDPLPERRELAARLGADRALHPEEEAARSLPRRREPGAFSCSFDCVGIPEAVHRAMELTNRLVILFAVQREPYVFSPDYWLGLILAGAQNHTRAAAEYAVKHLREGGLNLAPLVTECLPFEAYGEAVKRLRKQKALKFAFLPHGS